MTVSEAIILAGGLGTRLRGVINDLPKSIAPVAGKPFISYVIDNLRMQGIHRFIFALGYKHENLTGYLKENYPTLQYDYVIEKEPLGTGGAVRLAIVKATSDTILVANGDTLYKAEPDQLIRKHVSAKAGCTLALKPMQNFDRYGVVEIAVDGKVISFKEKQFYTAGLINGGLYLLNTAEFSSHSFPHKFSFRKNTWRSTVQKVKFTAVFRISISFDIGVPEDYEKAQKELASPGLDLCNIDNTWTLFVDRDGVINEERIGEYVLNWDQFIFSTGAAEAFQIFNEKFGRIIIVSNQRGVGRALMTEDALKDIHNEMQKEVEQAGGRIDKIYYCTEVDDSCFFRKPNPGMAVLAKRDFHDIDFTKAIMVGNKPGDMKFGRAAGMYNVFITTTNPQQPFPHPDTDLRFSSLLDFAKALKP